MSRDNYVLNSRSDGSIDYSDCYVDLQVTRGDNDVTAESTYVVTPENGVVGNWDESLHRYTVTSLTGIAKGTVSFAVTYDNVTLFKKFTVTIAYDGNDPIRTEIESSAGNIFKNKNISTVLTCHVYRGSEEITSQVTSFNWQKYNADGTLDENWNRIGAGSSISISSADVLSRAVFKCEVTF